MLSRITSLAVGTVLAALFVLPASVNAAYQPRGAASPVRAVTALVKPFYQMNTHPRCNAVEDKLAACPLTARLYARVNHLKVGMGNFVCRCQNPPRSVRMTLADNNGTVAHVNSVWVYGAGPNPRITFLVKHGHGGWLVDDTYCTGRPKTSVYTSQIGPC